MIFILHKLKLNTIFGMRSSLTLLLKLVLKNFISIGKMNGEKNIYKNKTNDIIAKKIKGGEMDNEYIKNAYDVERKRVVSGFSVKIINDVMYSKWNQPTKDGDGGWNTTTLLGKLDAKMISEIKEATKDYPTVLLSKQPNLEKEFEGVLKLTRVKSIYSRQSRQKIGYKSSLELKIVKTPEDMRKWADFSGKLFEYEPDFLYNSFIKDLETGCAAYYMGLENGEIVAVSQSIYGENSAGIYYVGVAEDKRCKGYGQDITAFAVNNSIDNGHDYFILSASEMGMKIYTKMGFEKHSNLYLYSFV